MISDFKDVPAAAVDLLAGRQISDYVNIALRRKWWIIVTATILSISVAVIALRLPPLYTADTVILVDAQKVPDTYVASTETATIADRLSTIQQQVMSETRLRKLIDNMQLYPEMKGRIGDQDIVKHMQRSIKVDIVSQGGRQLSAFHISFTDRSPVVAAQVANQLASMFIDENLKAREQQSFGTADFLESELAKTKTLLDQKEKTLSDIKRRNVMELPESKQYHLEALESLRSQVRASQDKVERTQQEKVYLQSLMASNAPTVDLDRQDASPYQQQIGKLETNISQLRTRYGPDYPDIRKLESQLEQLKQEQSEIEPHRPVVQNSPKQVARAHNPVIESQIERLDETLKQESKLQADLQPQLQFHMSKLENIPVFEQEMLSVSRDYETLRSYYTSLLDKKLEADTASALESRQKGERFVILDPAIAPEKPNAPNRVLFALAGIAGGILGGIGLAMVIEFSDRSIRNESELKQISGVQILGAVPRIRTRQERTRGLLQITAGMTAAVLVSAGLGWAVAALAARLS